MAQPDVDIPTRVLVMGMVRTDGTIDGQALYAVANACGMTDQQVRLCLHRLVTDGLFVRRGRGRRAVFDATPQGRATLEPDVEFVRFAYQQDHRKVHWDGRWHLVAFAVPESRRAARDALRDRVIELGGALLQGGVYVSPNAWEDYVEAVAVQLGAEEDVSFIRSDALRVGTETDPKRIAQMLWPLDEIADRYKRFIRVAKSRLRLASNRSVTEVDLLRASIEIAVEFNRAIAPDPLLPPELLPPTWPGATARALLAQSWHQTERAHPDKHLALFATYREVLAEAAAATAHA